MADAVRAERSGRIRAHVKYDGGEDYIESPVSNFILTRLEHESRASEDDVGFPKCRNYLEVATYSDIVRIQLEYF